VALGQQHLGEQRQYYRRRERHPVAHLLPPGHLLVAEESSLGFIALRAWDKPITGMLVGRLVTRISEGVRLES
jgi:hypothetical protein